MKTKFYWFALLASAALIAPAQAGGQHRGGGFVGGGGARISSPARAAAPSFRSMPRANFGGGGRFAAPGQRFSPVRGRSSSNAFRQHSINSSGGAAIGTRRFTPGSSNRGLGLTRFGDRGNRIARNANPTGERTGAIQNQAGGNRLARSGNNRRDHLAQSGNGAGERNRAIRNHDGRVQNGNNLPAKWRDHIAGRRSADWHRDWDRNRDHSWHGHHCRFINGSWVIFDFGFYPWWPYGYPNDYYAYDYYGYPDSYDPGYYDSGAYEGEEYYDQNGYESSDQNADSTVAAAQEQLARQGYYRGELDGIFGPETRSAIMRYQSDHGLRVTGRLNMDTLRALGLPRVASN
jgi:hypothetical protein